jgi:hypothetical protein
MRISCTTPAADGFVVITDPVTAEAMLRRLLDEKLFEELARRQR